MTGVEKVIRLRQNGTEQLFSARFECVVELGPDQKGAHMSRFEEVVNEAIGEVVLGESTFKAETLAEHIAQLVRERQGARRAEVTVEARFPEHKPARSRASRPRSCTRCTARRGTELGTRRLIGVTAQGMTACPCAQELVAASARAPRAEGFDDEIERILEAVPVATHNQRGLGTLHIGCTELCDDEIDAATLLEIVEQSMSSEIYELMKRSDEAHVVEKAHRRPAVRRGLRARDDPGVIDAFPQLDDGAFVSRARSTSRRSTSTTSSPSASARCGEIREELRTGEPAAAPHQPAAPGSTRSRSPKDEGQPMRAMVLERPGEPLKPRRSPTPTPARGQLLLKVGACAVCRTDLHLRDARDRRDQAAGRARPPDRRRAPRTAAASACRGWAGPTAPAATARSGRENLCVNARFTGRDIDGGYAELTVADERFCLPLPDELVRRAGRAAAVRRADRLPRADASPATPTRLGLYGFGSAAHMICQVAVHQGREVYAFTRAGDARTQEFARSARRHLGRRQRRAPARAARRRDHLRLGRASWSPPR